MNFELSSELLPVDFQLVYLWNDVVHRDVLEVGLSCEFFFHRLEFVHLLSHCLNLLLLRYDVDTRYIFLLLIGNLICHILLVHLFIPMSLALVDVVRDLVVGQLLVHFEYSELIFDRGNCLFAEFALFKFGFRNSCSV